MRYTGRSTFLERKNLMDLKMQFLNWAEENLSPSLDHESMATQIMDFLKSLAPEDSRYLLENNSWWRIVDEACNTPEDFPVV